jgi:thiamine phosphate synthase YjbQ (UPF0047 family)
MQCTVLPHITASVFINDDEWRLHTDYETRLEWERIFSGQAEWLAHESRWPAAEAGAGQDHR